MYTVQYIVTYPMHCTLHQYCIVQCTCKLTQVIVVVHVLRTRYKTTNTNLQKLPLGSDCGIFQYMSYLSTSTCQLTQYSYARKMYTCMHTSKDNVRRRYRTLVRLYEYVRRLYYIQTSVLYYVLVSLTKTSKLIKLNSCKMWRLPLAPLYSRF